MTENANGAAELTVDGTTLELPRVKSSIGMDGFRIDKMLASTGNVTLDPGFTNTASCESEITYIDGDVGILRYRGYPIEQLAANCSFLEVAYLLIYGELRTRRLLRSSLAALSVIRCCTRTSRLSSPRSPRADIRCPSCSLV